MSHEKSLAVRRFTNRNGVISWRVSGWMFGVRVRRNFKSREEAAAEKGILEIQASQRTSGLGTVVTSLRPEQIREAEAIFCRLSGQSHSLAFCVEYTLSNYRAPEREKLLSEAVSEYLAMRNKDQERGLVSAVQVHSITKELKLLVCRFDHQMVSSLKTAALTEFCERRKPSLKTHNNRRGILSTFFKFAFQRDWIPFNPVEKIPHHRIAHRRGSAKTLSAAQCRDLMAFVETYEGGCLVPFFALCLFAGIRPCVRKGEILKLKSEDVRLDTGTILVEPEVSKVRTKRNVAIQPNLAAWLNAYPIEELPIIPPNVQKLRAAVAKRFGLSKDIMRHTFISMFVAKFRSMGEAALQAGNSESIIKKHYLDLKSTDEAAEFFGIQPQKTLASRKCIEHVDTASRVTV
jgi:integrase